MYRVLFSCICRSLFHVDPESPFCFCLPEWFLRYILHEMRVPFNSISLGLNMLEVFPDHEETLQQMRRASASMRAIINDTLDLSQLAQGHLRTSCQVMCITELLGDCVFNSRPFANDPGNCVALERRVDPALLGLRLWGDKRHLEQILTNFINNAIKFSPHDGSGRVCVSAQLASQVDLSDVVWKVEGRGKQQQKQEQRKQQQQQQQEVQGGQEKEERKGEGMQTSRSIALCVNVLGQLEGKNERASEGASGKQPNVDLVLGVRDNGPGI